MPKLLPYGKVLLSIEKPTNDIYLFIGRNAFYKAKKWQISRPGTLCIPGYICPSSYSYSVQGHDILIFDTSYSDDQYINDVVYYLYQYGARKVRLVTSDFKLLTFAQ